MIELRNKGTKAMVDLKGAWVTHLSDRHGDVLFPKRTLQLRDGSGTKVRGGCHICLPNFGPGGSSGQPQHGFGREQVWVLKDHTAISATLMLEHGYGEYEKLSSAVTYQLTEDSLQCELTLMNKGDKDLRIAPGFHPYFTLTKAETSVIVAHKRELLDELEDTMFTQGARMELTTARRHFVLSSKQLNTWAIWSDQLGSYVCVEPTLGGYMFLQERPRKEEILPPGERRSYGFLLQWDNVLKSN